jgi:hypothetical protein
MRSSMPLPGTTRRHHAELVDGVGGRRLPGDALCLLHRRRDLRGRNRRRAALRQSPPADGLSRPGPRGALDRREGSTSPSPAIGTPGVCWSKGLGPTAIRPASTKPCDPGSRDRRRPSARSPGRLKSVFVRAIACSALPARRRLWSSPRSPAKWRFLWAIGYHVEPVT